MPVEISKVKELFLAVLEMPAAERAAYLDTACAGDTALRQQIEAMLQSHENSGELLPRSPAQMLQGGTTDADATGAFAPPADPSATQINPTQHESNELSFLAPSAKPGQLGRLGPYEVQKVLGKGGFGVVLKAFDERLHRVVAIKVLSPAYAAIGMARKRFIREAQAAAAVKNEHVVGIHDVDANANPPYLVMEYIEGVSLQDKIDKDGTIGVKEILRIGMQMAEGLAAAHKQGLVHRDIKPANILLENGVERVKITDFGLARAVDDASVTQSGTVAGTPMYMSPEQAEGVPIDHRSDLFSLGTVLYAMCTGHPPFRASGTHAVLKRVIDASPRPIREINNEVPDWLCDIIAKLHAKKPEDRFQTAKEVGELLGAKLADVQAGRASGEPSRVGNRAEAPATEPAPRLPTRHGSPRRRLVYAGMAIVAFLAGGIAIAELTDFTHFFHAPASNSQAGRGDLQITGDVGVENIVVRRGDEEIATLVDLKRSTTLDPGTYEFHVVTRPGAKVKEIRIETAIMGQAALSKTLPPAARFSLALGRAEKAHVFILTESEPGWVQLFNGKDLTGWKYHPEQPGMWTVKDGILTSAGAQSHLFTEAGDYQDFHLRVQARINKGGDSGVFFRSHFKLMSVGQPVFSTIPIGYEAQIMDTGLEAKTGSLFCISTTARTNFPKHLIKRDEWFSLEVIAQGDHIKIRVNDQTTVDITDSGHTYSKGHLALQHSGPATLAEFRKIEIKKLPATSPSPAVAPFVVLARDDQAERKFASLAEAVTAAISGDTVEIQGNGPFVAAPLVLLEKRLTIRAGQGYRPVLTPSTETTKWRPFFDTNAPLVLEGLEFRINGQPFAPPEKNAYHYAIMTRQPLYLANCRFVAKAGQFATIRSSGSSCQLLNCQFLGADLHGALDWKSSNGGKVLLKNCQQAGNYFWFAWHDDSPELNNVTVQLTDNTVLAGPPLELMLGVVPGQVEAPFHMKVSRNILLAARQAFTLSVTNEAAEKKIKGNKAEVLKQLVRWHGLQNVYGNKSDFVYLGGEASQVRSLQDWKQFWGSAEENSQRELPSFEGGDLLKLAASDPERIEANHFRLKAGSPGKGAGPGGKVLPAFFNEQLKLTVEQITAVENLQKDVDVKLGTLFTDAQKKQWKEMKDNPGRGVGGPGGRDPGGPPKVGQIVPEFVQEQLRLTGAQKEKVVEVQKEVDTRLAQVLAEKQKKQWKEIKDKAGSGGPGGKDIGADADLVGPGAAYEKWKQTPEYQEWRQKTAQLPDGKWVQLFNGKDLSGWNTDNAKWVVNGAIVADSAGHIVSDRTFANNFHLRMEVKLRSGSGIIRFRTLAGRVGQWNVILEDNKKGTIDARILSQFPARDGKGMPLAKVRHEGVGRIDDWLVLEIIAQDRDATVQIDGKPSMFLHDENYTLAPGHLSLAIAPSDPQDSEMYVRKIEIKELPPDEPGWVQLFNGKDLTGWFVGEGRFDVEDGNLVGRKACYLMSQRDNYTNYHLRIEAKIDKDCHGDVLFGHVNDGMGLIGYRSSIRPNWTVKSGTLLVYSANKRDGTVLQPVADELIEPEKWFTHEVIVRGSHITVKINGKTVVDKTDAPIVKGRVGILSNRAIGTIWVKKIELRELSPEEPAFKPLFNGKDLTGWHVSDTHPGSWTVKDGILTGKFGDDKRWLRTVLVSDRKDLANFRARMEVKLNTGNMRVAVHAQPPSYTPNEMFLALNAAPDKALGVTVQKKGPPHYFRVEPAKLRDEWFTLEIVAQAPVITYRINGALVAEVYDARFEPGSLTLDVGPFPESILWVRKIEIKELPPQKPATPE